MERLMFDQVLEHLIIRQAVGNLVGNLVVSSLGFEDCLWSARWC
jgi:hypothetical protein